MTPLQQAAWIASKEAECAAAQLDGLRAERLGIDHLSIAAQARLENIARELAAFAEAP